MYEAVRSFTLTLCADGSYVLQKSYQPRRGFSKSSVPALRTAVHDAISEMVKLNEKTDAREYAVERRKAASTQLGSG